MKCMQYVKIKTLVIYNFVNLFVFDYDNTLLKIISREKEKRKEMV